MKQTKQTRRNEDEAGWSYFQPGSCCDRHTGVSYPWHEEYVGQRVDGRPEARGYCVRCGEQRPE